MKLKATIIAIILLIIVITSITFYFINPYLLTNNHTVNIQKPEQYSNEQFINLLTKTANDTNVEIYVMYQSVTNREKEINYYTTDESKLEEGYNAYDGAISETNFYPLSELENFNLVNESYIVEGDITLFRETLENMDIYIQNSDNIYPSKVTKNQFSLLICILILLMVLLLFIDIIKKHKKNIYKYQNGYTHVKVIFENLFSTSKIFLISLFIIVMSLILIYLYFGQEFLINLLYYIIPIFLLLILISILTVTMITLILGYKINMLKVVKNGFSFPKILNGCYAIQLLTLFFIITSLFFNANNIRENNKLISRAEEFAYLEDYSYVPIYYGSDFPEDTQLGYLYFDLVSNEEVIVANIDPLSSNEDLEGMRRSVINSTYLEYNEIYDINGNRITDETLDDNYLNVLVPISLKDEPEITEVSEPGYSKNLMPGEKVNIIYVPDNSQYFLYDITKPVSEQYASDVVAVVISQETVEEALALTPDALSTMGMVLTSQNWYVKTDNEDPYSTIEPYVQKYGLSDNIIEAPKLTNKVTNLIVENQIKNLFLIMRTIIYVVFLFIITSFINQIITNSRVKYKMLQKVNGQKFRIIYDKEIKFKVKVIIFTSIAVLLVTQNILIAMLVLSFIIFDVLNLYYLDKKSYNIKLLK